MATMTPDEALIKAARGAGPPLGQVQTGATNPEREAYSALMEWRRVDLTHGTFDPTGLDALGRLRDVADRILAASMAVA